MRGAKTQGRPTCAAGLFRGPVVVALLAAAWGIGGGTAPPARAAAGEESPRLGDAARRTAIRRAVERLVADVPKLPEMDGSPRKQFTQATTGLVLLLDGGTAARTGRSLVSELRSDLARWLDRVARESRDPARLPPGPGVADSRCLVQYVWPTSQAALLFAEMDARDVERDEARKALRTCITILAEARYANGGWGHGRFRTGGTSDRPELGRMAGGYPETLVAATNCAAVALGAARAALGKDAVPDLEPTRGYYREARLRNGSMPYDPSQRSADLGETNAGRTAGALVAMRALSMPQDEGWRLSVRYVESARGSMAEGHGSPCLNLFHGALAARLLGDDSARAFRDVFQPRLIQAQAADGRIACPCERKAFGVTCDDPMAQMPAIFADDQRTYATALNALTLLLLDGKSLRALDRIEAQPVTTPRTTPRK